MQTRRAIIEMTKPNKQQPKEPERQHNPAKRKRGRPEKPLKIDDTPENVARSLFGLPPIKSTKKRDS